MTVDGDSITVYVVEADEEFPVGDVDGLVAWLDARWPTALVEQREGVAARLRSGRFFRWE